MIKKFSAAFAIGLAASTVLSLLFSFGVFESWQSKLSDSLFAPRKAREDIVIIAIDDRSIQAIGRWPWDRSVHARLINNLQFTNSKPRAIGIDISFFEKSDTVNDQNLALAIKKAGNITLAAEEVNGEIILPISKFSENAKVGVVNTSSDPDGITRKSQADFAEKIIGIKSKITEDNLTRVNFIGKPGSFTTYSYIDVLGGKIEPGVFKNKIVLIGATAPDLHDSQMIPTSTGTPMVGVEIHAHTIQTILDSKYLTVQPKQQTVIFILVIGFLTLFIFIFSPLWLSVVIMILSLLFFLLWAIFSFDHGVIVNLVFPPISIIVAFISSVIYKYFSEFGQKRFIKKAFSYYLSGPILEEILKNPSKLILGGERKKITVLFTDIEGFTSISERTDPEELARELNNYLTQVTDIVFKYNGVLDKFVGDAVMAFWGAPIPDTNQAANACKAALEIAKVKSNLKFRTRVGVNTGEMVVGNMGSRQRFDYTLIGDNVNLGSRLEGLNKEYGTTILISEGTYKEIKDEFTTRKIDLVAVKGKTKPIAVYELGSFNDKLFEKGRQLYESGKFAKARDIFSSLSKKYPHDGPTRTYLARSQTLAKEKPEKWNGVFIAKNK